MRGNAGTSLHRRDSGRDGRQRLSCAGPGAAVGTAVAGRFTNFLASFTTLATFGKIVAAIQSTYIPTTTSPGSWAMRSPTFSMVAAVDKPEHANWFQRLGKRATVEHLRIADHPAFAQIASDQLPELFRLAAGRRAWQP